MRVYRHSNKNLQYIAIAAAMASKIPKFTVAVGGGTVLGYTGCKFGLHYREKLEDTKMARIAAKTARLEIAAKTARVEILAKKELELMRMKMEQNFKIAEQQQQSKCNWNMLAVIELYGERAPNGGDNGKKSCNGAGEETGKGSHIVLEGPKPPDVPGSTEINFDELD